MTRRSPVPLAAVSAAFVAMSFASALALAQTPDPSPTPVPPPRAVLKFGDSTLRFGTILQPTYDVTQDANSQGYEQNWYMRRVRFYMIGDISPTINFFFQTDDPRVGNAGAAGPKNIAGSNGNVTGFLVQDAYLQWNFAGNAAGLQVGEWIVPTVRQVHTSVATFMSLDLPTWALQQNTALQGNGGRDYGAGFNGYLLDDHFSYRVGVFEGNRQGTTNQAPPLGPAAAARNSPRFAGRLMYDFFDSEKGYTYMGTYLGRKKVVAIAAVGDTQGDYTGYGGDVFVDWPVPGMDPSAPDAVTFESDYMHYNGQGKFYLAAIGEQETFFANAGYYLGGLKLQPFIRYETLVFDHALNEGKEQTRMGGGINYYVMWQNLKLTAYYEKIRPEVRPGTAAIKDTNRFVFQWQLYL
jgi:hypothetical protein